MNKFLVIGFEFCETFYYSLILCKPQSDCKEYRITVMNGDLEKLLCSNNIIREINGSLQMEISQNKQQQLVKIAIANALSKFIGIPLNTKSESLEKE